MSSTKWIYEIPLKTLGVIEKEITEELKTRFNITDNNFSAVGSSNAPAVFPFIYIKTLPISEVGRTLDRVISGVRVGFQVEVVDNKSQQNARKVMIEISDILTKYGFMSKDFGFYEDTKDIHRLVSRFERVIGDGDTLF